MFFGMPIHIIRDVALTVRSFYKRITDFLKYRQATKDMNARYPDATAEDMTSEDVCIICRESMRPWPSGNGGATPVESVNDAMDERLRPKKLPCGHVLHFACLRSWLERQQVCPTCRRPVLDTATPTSPRPNGAGNERGIIGPLDPLPGAEGIAETPPHLLRREDAQNNRIHYVNFGPLRVGFGAGNLNALQQQINEQPPGTGIRPSTTQAPGSPVDSQLHGIEQQMMREVNDLQAQAEELSLIRAMQGELARLRIARAARAADATSSSVPSLRTPIVAMPSPMQAFVPDPRANLRGSSTTPLPAGISIPDGWTLLPLQRLPAHGPTPPWATGIPMPVGVSHLAHTPSIPTVQPPSFASTAVPSGPHVPAIGEASSSRPSIVINSPSDVGSTAQASPEAHGHIPLQSVSSWPADAEAGSATPATPATKGGSCGSSTQGQSSKGKGRATTVEDVGDDNELVYE